MARLLIVAPEADFHTLFADVLAQAGYVAVEAANSYEGRPAADAARRADGRGPGGGPHGPTCSWSKRRHGSSPSSVTSWPRMGYVGVGGGPQRGRMDATDPAGRADGRRDIRYLVVC